MYKGVKGDRTAGMLRGWGRVSVELEWEQGQDCLGYVDFNVGLLFILRVEALKQVVGVEIEKWECHDLIYGWKKKELI